MTTFISWVLLGISTAWVTHAIWKRLEKPEVEDYSDKPMPGESLVQYLLRTSKK